MKSHIEINAANLEHNLHQFAKLTQKKLMFVVKANAYGHGLKEVISIAKDIPSVGFYAVDSVEEALTVRGLDKNKQILIIGWADNDQLKEIIANGFEMVAPSVEYLHEVQSIAKNLGKKAKVHLKVETGTSRMGMPPGQVTDILNHSKYIEPARLQVTGLYSHFANIEDTTDHSFAQHQLKIFNDMLAKIDHRNLLKHFSCSASALLFPKTYFDIVRVGISAYGFWPSKPTYVSYIEKRNPPIDLKPVLAWYSKVAQVKNLEKGDSIGYGLTYKAFDKARIVVIPVGYYDGYDRKLSNASTVFVNGVKAPVRGRVCMDMFMASVTHIGNVKQGDTVVLIGETGSEKISADDLAELAGTINYEIVSRINPLIPRVVV